MFLPIAISILAVGSFCDGYTTNLAIRKGAHEADRIMVWIFGTAIPTPKTVYLRGGITIAAESALALTFAHFWPHVGLVLAVLLCAQAGMHFYEFCRTLRMY